MCNLNKTTSHSCLRDEGAMTKQLLYSLAEQKLYSEVTTIWDDKKNWRVGKGSGMTHSPNVCTHITIVVFVRDAPKNWFVFPFFWTTCVDVRLANVRNWQSGTFWIRMGGVITGLKRLPIVCGTLRSTVTLRLFELALRQLVSSPVTVGRRAQEMKSASP